MVGNFIETLIIRRVEDCLIPSIFVGYSVVISTRVLKYGWKTLRGTGAMLWGIYYNVFAVAVVNTFMCCIKATNYTFSVIILKILKLVIALSVFMIT